MSTETQLDVLSIICLGGVRERDDNESVGIARVLGKIRTVHLWTTNHNICRLTTTPCFVSLHYAITNPY